MGFWVEFTGSIVFDVHVEDDIFLMEELIKRNTNSASLKGLELSYHRQVSRRQPMYEKYPNSMVNRKTATSDLFKRQPNERLSTEIRAINFYRKESDNTALEVFKKEIEDIIEGLNSVYRVSIATFVFKNDISVETITYTEGKFKD